MMKYWKQDKWDKESSCCRKDNLDTNIPTAFFFAIAIRSIYVMFYNNTYVVWHFSYQ
jgi:hypothetical protein